MNIMKFLPAVTLLLALNVNAQRNHRENQNMTVEQRVERGSEHAQKELGLTPDQKEKWKTAARERIGANDALREKMKGSTTPEQRKQLREEARKNNSRFDDAVTGMLDAGQKQKYEAKKKERVEKRRQHRKKHADGIDDED
jgi:hypothetical protein